MAKDKIGASAAFWLVMILLLLILPLWFLKGDTGSSSAEPELQALVVTPRPAAGGNEATLSRTLVAGKWNAATPLPQRLQFVRNACASLPDLEDGPLWRMTKEDADAVDALLDALPFEDVTTRIEWAKPVVGSSTHMQESLISGGMGFGLFDCVDELTAATAWAHAGSRGWSTALEACGRRGGQCPERLMQRLRQCESRVEDCARHMRFAEITEFKELLGAGSQPPPPSLALRQLSGWMPDRLRALLQRIEQAKLAQNPG